MPGFGWLAYVAQWWRGLPRTPKLQIKMGQIFPRKNTRKRKKEPDEIVFHEPVARGVRKIFKILKRRGLSVEYTVARADGVVHQHVKDVKKRRCIHAGGAHNKRSVAIEMENRYYGSKAIEGETVIKAVWAHRGKYILPTPVQAEACWQLVCYLDTLFETDLRRFPGVKDGHFKWGRDKHAAKAPGVKAHHRWHHADGLFPEHYCACRDLGLSKEEAWSYTVEAASAGKRLTMMPEPREV